ncbi:MAG: cytochrome P450 [Myxococcota bacterium]
MSSKPEAGLLNLFDPEVAAAPQPHFKEMRSRCPVSRNGLNGGAVLTRYEDVIHALRHPEIFSSEMGAASIGNKRPLIPLQLDPPQQTRFRKLLDPLFSRKRVWRLESEVRELANQLIDQFVDHGECEFNHEFAVPYPCTVFLRLMGLPLEDLDTFLGFKDNIIRPDVDVNDLEQAQRIRNETGEKIYAYFENFLEERSLRPKDDLITHFMTAEVDGEKLTREEILDICYLFLLGGLDTVTASLGCFVSYLAQNPDQRRRLVESPSLIEPAVEEMLRWETPVVQVVRILKQDTTVGGVELRKGETVTLVLGSADTDDAEFVDAARVDLERRRNRHLAFGGGPHRCLGSHLARMELRIAMEELHRRIPVYAIRPGESPRYSPAIREVVYLPLFFGEGVGA